MIKQLLKCCTILIIIAAVFIGQTSFASSNTNQDEYDYYNKLKKISEKFSNDDFYKNISEGILSNKKQDKAFLIKNIVNNIFKEIDLTFSQVLIIMIICLIYSILFNVQNSFKTAEVSKATFYAFLLVIVTIVLKNLEGVLKLTYSTLSKSTSFIESLTPIVLTVLASSGYITYATVINPLIAFSVVFSSQILLNLVTPISSIYLLISIIANIDERVNLKKLLGFIKTLILWCAIFGLAVFTGLISVEGFTGASVDNFTAKSIKYTVGNFVPVVGKILSDAADAIAGSLSLVKNTTTVFGLVFLLLIIGIPLLKILIISFVFRLASSLIEIYSDKKFAQFMSDYADNLMILFAVVFASMALFLISFTAILFTVQIGR
ncbi:stage III sporulation protein AE [Caldicellulosiruptoraceae bacterium PP1]